MENKQNKSEKQLIALYWDAALRAQFQIDKYGFHAIMPQWEDFKEYMTDKLID